MSSGFDESKVQRDEHGRFSGGSALGAWAAKKSGKLEGYSKGDSKTGAGRLEHDPSKETSPLSKWVASKNSIELDLLKSSKNDRNPSTGELNAGNSVRASDFIHREIGRLTMQKEALVKEARKSEVSRVGYQNKAFSAKVTLQDVTPAAGDEDKDRAARDEATKALGKYTQKEKEAAAKRDAAHEKLGNVLAQWRSANDAERVMRTVNDQLNTPHRHASDEEVTKENLGIIKDDKKDYAISVSHDRQGNWEINARADTRAASHPGEKTMTYRVAPGAPPKIESINKHKEITFARDDGGLAMRVMIGSKLAPTHTMELLFPPHKDTGASHPLEGEHHYKPASPGRMGANADDHNPRPQDFFNERDTSKP